MELVCPAGSLPALKAAVDNGADSVYAGFRNATNARNFPGLNFDKEALAAGVAYAHAAGKKVLFALNTHPAPGSFGEWAGTLDAAVAGGIDAVIMADVALIEEARNRYPDLAIHLSVQGSATSAEAVNFYRKHFGIARVILPRVLSVEQIKRLKDNTDVAIEVFGFGSLCVMVEGRCALSSYITGSSPNLNGVCSPASAVRWQNTPASMTSHLNGVLINRFSPGEKAAYPTVCKARFAVEDETYYAIEEPASLNTLEILPDLIGIGVDALKIEGRQRSPSYTAATTKVLREAIDCALSEGGAYAVRHGWLQTLSKLSEGSQATLGAYSRNWK